MSNMSVDNRNTELSFVVCKLQTVGLGKNPNTIRSPREKTACPSLSALLPEKEEKGSSKK